MGYEAGRGRQIIKAVWSSFNPLASSGGQSSPSPPPGARLLGCAHISLNQSLAEGCWGGHLLFSGTFGLPWALAMEKRDARGNQAFLAVGRTEGSSAKLLRSLAGSLPPLESCSGLHVLYRIRPALPTLGTLLPCKEVGSVGTQGSQ